MPERRVREALHLARSSVTVTAIARMPEDPTPTPRRVAAANRRRRHPTGIPPVGDAPATRVGALSALPVMFGLALLVKVLVLFQLGDHPLLQPLGDLDGAHYIDLARQVAARGPLAVGEVFYVSPLYMIPRRGVSTRRRPRGGEGPAGRARRCRRRVYPRDGPPVVRRTGGHRSVAARDLHRDLQLLRGADPAGRARSLPGVVRAPPGITRRLRGFVASGRDCWPCPRNVRTEPARTSFRMRPWWSSGCRWFG